MNEYLSIHPCVSILILLSMYAPCPHHIHRATQIGRQKWFATRKVGTWRALRTAGTCAPSRRRYIYTYLYRYIDIDMYLYI